MHPASGTLQAGDSPKTKTKNHKTTPVHMTDCQSDGEPVSVIWRNQTICQLNVGMESTVRELKILITKETGIPEDEQLLICAEHVLREDPLSLEAIGFKPGQAIYLVVPWWAPDRHREPESPDTFDLLVNGLWDILPSMTCWSLRDKKGPAHPTDPPPPSPAVPQRRDLPKCEAPDPVKPTAAPEVLSPLSRASSFVDLLASSASSSPLPTRTALDLSRGRPCRGR